MKMLWRETRAEGRLTRSFAGLLVARSLKRQIWSQAGEFSGCALPLPSEKSSLNS